MKNTFCLVSTYISWSSLSLPTPRIRLHGLCSPPTGKTMLLQAVQIQLLSLCNERRHLQAGLLCVMIGDILEGGVYPQGEVRCVQG